MRVAIILRNSQSMVTRILIMLVLSRDWCKSVPISKNEAERAADGRKLFSDCNFEREKLRSDNILLIPLIGRASYMSHAINFAPYQPQAYLSGKEGVGRL